MGVKNDLFLVSVLNLARFLCRGIEIDLILERGSKLTLFQRWGRNLLGFRVEDRTSLFVRVVEIDFVVFGAIIVLFCMDRN